MTLRLVAVVVDDTQDWSEHHQCTKRLPHPCHDWHPKGVATTPDNMLVCPGRMEEHLAPEDIEEFLDGNGR